MILHELNISLPDQLLGLCNLVTNERTGIMLRIWILDVILSLLTSADDFFKSWAAIAGNAKEVSYLIESLLGVSYHSNDAIIHDLVGRCLGQLGAIDPQNMNLNLSPSKVSKYSCMNNSTDEWVGEYLDFGFERNDDFIVHILDNYLVTAIRSSANPARVDRVGYTVQELLRILIDIKSPELNTSSDGGIRRRKKETIEVLGQRVLQNVNFTKPEAVELLKPYLSTDYKITNKNTKLFPPFYTYADNFDGWLQCFVRFMVSVGEGVGKTDLLDSANQYQQFKQRQHIFEACRSLGTAETDVVLFLLPYLVDQLLTSLKMDERTFPLRNGGKENIYNIIKREIEAVLSDTGTTGIAHRCNQVVFSLCSTLSAWFDNPCVKMSMRMKGKHDRSHKWKKDKQEHRLAVRDLVSSIPQLLMAKAALRCNADAKALQALENHLRSERVEYETLMIKRAKMEQRRRSRQQKGIIDEELNIACRQIAANMAHLATMAIPLDFALMSVKVADLHMLEHVYCSIDDSDGLSGLLALAPQIMSLNDASNYVGSSESNRALKDRLLQAEHDKRWKDSISQRGVLLNSMQIEKDNFVAKINKSIKVDEYGESEMELYHGQLKAMNRLGWHEMVVEQSLAQSNRIPLSSSPASNLNDDVSSCDLESNNALQLEARDSKVFGQIMLVGCEAAIELGRWDDVQELLHKHDSIPGPGHHSNRIRHNLCSAMFNLWQRVAVLRSADKIHLEHSDWARLRCDLRSCFNDTLKDCRLDCMSSLKVASTESFQRCYPILLRLQEMTELEQVWSFIDDIENQFGYLPGPEKIIQETLSSSRNLEYVFDDRIVEKWSSALKLTQSSLKNRNILLSARRAICGMLHMPKLQAKQWLETSRLAKEECDFEVADSSLLAACAFGNQSAVLESAEMLKSQGKIAEAVQVLEPVEINPDVDWKGKPITIDDMRALRLATDWMVESGLKQSDTILNRYNFLAQFNGKDVPLDVQERITFSLAKYYDLLYENNRSNWDYMFNAVSNYIASLKYGNRFVYHSLSRILTLWMESVSMRSVRSETTLNTHKNRMNALVTTCMENVSPDRLMGGLVQMISYMVTCEKDDGSKRKRKNINLEANEVFKIVSKGVSRCLVEYPDVVVWHMMPLRLSGNVIRRAALDILLKGKTSRIQQMIQALHAFSSSMVDTANYDIHGNNRRSKPAMKPRKQTKDSLKYIRDMKIVMPTQKFMDITDVSDTKKVYLCDIDPYIKIMNSKAKPKRIELKGSDGNKFGFLCKVESRGDLRKDARMMAFCEVVNRLFISHPQGRQRKLHLQTFAVVCLSQQVGLLEWMEGTADLQSLIEESYYLKHPNVPLQLLSKDFISIVQEGVVDGPNCNRPGKRLHDLSKIIHKSEDALSMLHDMSVDFDTIVLPQYPPCLHQWFSNSFPEPSAWFDARQTYIRSLSIWSMVGFVIGLGDRHSRNLLVFKDRAEIVHVDFDVSFDKGRNLAIAEKVPFRLTRNMTDAMGPAGLHGGFMRVAEIAMGLMRENKEMLMCVLNVFVHEPLLDWKSGKTSEDSNSSDDLETVMTEIQNRLNGMYSARFMKKWERGEMPQSVSGQVRKLVNEATSSANLSQMYHYWLPHL
eukprot:TRINITY_DN2506_c0_g3_i3.p1 TRINITY_DN2506_c0_g3~~TRINITY_DN2506_c0_g3_i3.p1  ORF type:complete len:1613 (+),score=417.49 TRINITY_DN2506_c0_g3_i3:99-4937(+)